MAPHKSALPKQAVVTSHLEIFPPIIPNRMVRGREISVYYNIQSDSTWAKHQRSQIEIAVFFDLSVCHMGWGNTGSKWSEREMRGRQICIIPAGKVHECRLAGKAELLVLYADAEPLKRATGKNLTDVSIQAVAQYEPEVWMLATLLRRLCSAQIRPPSRTIDAIGGELAYRLIDGTSDDQLVPLRCRLSLSRTQREKVMQYMQSNLKYDIHVIDLAKQSGHSVSHFTELFVNTTGKAPYQYLKELRIVRAYELLMTGDYLAREAALEVGYSNADHFGEVFRVFCGYSPRELLRRVRTGLVKAPPEPVKYREASASPEL